MAHIDYPKPEEPVCYNCRYVMWLVAIGQGVLCKHPENAHNGKPMLIHSLRQTCQYFRPKHSQPSSTGAEK